MHQKPFVSRCQTSQLDLEMGNQGQEMNRKEKRERGREGREKVPYEHFSFPTSSYAY